MFRKLKHMIAQWQHPETTFMGTFLNASASFIRKNKSAVITFPQPNPPNLETEIFQECKVRDYAYFHLKIHTDIVIVLVCKRRIVDQGWNDFLDIINCLPYEEIWCIKDGSGIISMVQFEEAIREGLRNEAIRVNHIYRGDFQLDTTLWPFVQERGSIHVC